MDRCVGCCIVDERREDCRREPRLEAISFDRMSTLGLAGEVAGSVMVTFSILVDGVGHRMTQHSPNWRNGVQDEGHNTSGLDS